MEIEILTGPLKGKRMSLDAGIHLVGRGVGPLPFQDPGLSQEHAKLHVFTHRMEVEDVGSTNGTFVNGERVSRKGLALGDEVRLGPESSFRIIDRATEEAARREALKARSAGLPPPFTPHTEHPRMISGDSGSAARVPEVDVVAAEATAKASAMPAGRPAPLFSAPPLQKARMKKAMRLAALAALLIGGVTLAYYLSQLFSTP